jgi:serine phosphatase RsbU (regulator of sigma subunit)
LGRYKEALQYTRESLAIYQFKNDKIYIAKTYISLANIYQLNHRRDSAFFYTRAALKIYFDAGNSKGIANGCELLTNLFADIKNQDSSLYYAFKALEIEKKLQNWVNVAGTYINVHKAYYDKKDFKNAISALDSSLKYAMLTHNLEILHLAYFDQGNLHFLNKQYKESAEAYRNALDYKDSTLNEQINEEFARMSAQYENDKKEHELNMVRKEKELDELKLKSSRFYLYLSLIGAITLMLLLAFIYYRYKERKKSHEVLQVQHKEIKQQKEEITDSIAYAKRIQQAILPPDRVIERLFPDGFIFYKPKDIVSGDFYFLDEKNGKTVFAAVDCTGHGVPGAMVSVVGFNILSQAVREKGLTNPAEILNFLDKGVNDTLRQSENESGIKDGMDLAVCSYDPLSKTLQYAGAFNPFILVRKNVKSELAAEHEKYFFTGENILEIKADKFPIGNNADGVTDAYTQHELRLRAGDSIYIYSDGFADQFGGDTRVGGKKFLYKRLKFLLEEISELSVREQKEKLNSVFTEWKGKYEQVDDVLVMGLKIN